MPGEILNASLLLDAHAILGEGPLWGPLVVGEIVFSKTPRGRLPDRQLGWQEIAEILSHTAVDILFDQIGSPDDREKVSGRWRGGEGDARPGVECPDSQSPVGPCVSDLM